MPVTKEIEGRCGATKYYNFRIRSRRWIEVLAHAVRETPELSWIAQAGYQLSLSGYCYAPIIFSNGRMTRPSLKAGLIPEVYLVPLAEWQRRAQ